MTAEIVELWKAGPETQGRYKVGSPLAFHWEGGSVSVGGKTVRTRISWVRHLEPRGTYLVFGWFPEGELRISPQSIYQVTGSTISAVNVGASGSDDIEVDTLENVRGRVENALRRP